jgi:hypothetical protein
VEETKPVVEEIKPVVEETKPVVEEIEPFVEEKTVEESKKEEETVVEEKKEEVPVTSGFLSLTLTKATLKHDTELFGRMDPFVNFEYNGVCYRSKVALD